MDCKLRNWKMEDAQELAAAINNKKVQDNLRDGLPFPYAVSDAQQFIGAMLCADRENTFAFAITLEDKVIGSIGVFRKDNIHSRTAEMGYYIAEPYWGKGAGTSAVRQMCGYIFENTDIMRIFAEPFAYNTASCRILEKSGFEYEGTLRSNAVKNGQVIDMKMYAIVNKRKDFHWKRRKKMSLWMKKAKQLTPWLYAVQDSIGSFIYILTGAQKALVFDTGYGMGNLPAAVRKVTHLPYTVVLSHGHTDHSCGAFQFPQALLHPADMQLAREQTGQAYRGLVLNELKAHGIFIPPWRAKQYKEAGAGKLEPLDENAVFDLGGLHARCVPMPGHTEGSVGLLVEEHRVLIAGDAANRNLWLFLPESKSLSAYADMLARVRPLAFDTFYTGHDSTPMNKEREFALYESVARNACAENAKRVQLASPFSHFECYSYTEKNADGTEAGILFALDKL